MEETKEREKKIRVKGKAGKEPRSQKEKIKESKEGKEE